MQPLRTGVTGGGGWWVHGLGGPREARPAAEAAHLRGAAREEEARPAPEAAGLARAPRERPGARPAAALRAAGHQDAHLPEGN